MSWLLLHDGPAPGAWNMALDEALLEAASAGQRTLRLYAWNPPAISFGRHEPALRRYDRDAIHARGLAAVRRPTGGRAVWHHRELTYSVAAPSGTFGTLQDTYHEIHAMLADALAALGAPVALAAARAAAPVGAGACFASPAGGEVVTDTGRKLVGSAQVRSGAAFLQHGSVLLAAEQDVVADVTRGDAAAPAEAGLRSLIGAGATWAAVADAVSLAAARRWKSPAHPGALPQSVRDRAESLRPHYADDDWTWRH
ncbi:MAG: biotin/lipoate A/B protein ligase family protein [Gemmatimonadales bacterium]